MATNHTGGVLGVWDFDTANIEWVHLPLLGDTEPLLLHRRRFNMLLSLGLGLDCLFNIDDFNGACTSRGPREICDVDCLVLYHRQRNAAWCLVRSDTYATTGLKLLLLTRH